MFESLCIFLLLVAALIAGLANRSLGDMVRQVFNMFILTVAVAEAAIRVAILVIYIRNRGSIKVADINTIHG